MKDAIECALARTKFQTKNGQTAFKNKREKSAVKRMKFEKIDAMNLKYTYEEEAVALKEGRKRNRRFPERK